MNHWATARFWGLYRSLPEHIRQLADRNFTLLKENPRRPSLHFKTVGKLWSVRVGAHHRAPATEAGGDLVWFWIGSHADYDHLSS